MRPGVPHFVYGPEHTICYGGHFYATSLMQATLSSLMHGFVIGTFITNITHHPSRSLLRRILLLYHVALIENRFQPAGRYAASCHFAYASDSFHRRGILSCA